MTPTAPRAGSARFALLSVLGEFVIPAGEPVYNAALVAVLREVGHTPAAARQAISRAAAAGWLHGRRRGREVRWSVSEAGRALVLDGVRRVEALGGDPLPWDGSWVVVFVSIPHDQRAERERVTRLLRWAGCGNPAPTVWVAPHADRRDRIRTILAEHRLNGSALAFAGARTVLDHSDADLVARAWDLDELAITYRELVAAFGHRRPRSPGAALASLIELDLHLRRLPSLDPLLPSELTPGWAGRRAATRLLARRAAWMPLARARWDEISATRLSDA